MPKDDRDILEILKLELEFLEKGGYGRSVRRPQEPTSVFQDSLSCFGFPDRVHDDCCLLTGFVPPECLAASVPCHHIALNEKGDTVESLSQRENQEELEETVKRWLRARIAEIEQQRAGLEVRTAE